MDLSEISTPKKIFIILLLLVVLSLWYVAELTNVISGSKNLIMFHWSSYKSHWNLYSIIALTGCVLVNICLLIGAIWRKSLLCRAVPLENKEWRCVARYTSNCNGEKVDYQVRTTQLISQRRLSTPRLVQTRFAHKGEITAVYVSLHLILPALTGADSFAKVQKTFVSYNSQKLPLLKIFNSTKC
ncbi:hypothetical protein GQX74_003545 [Glossina fuscipes]|nr:hypothetical protein GQX74_003545 [Glossina fuscipes]